MLQRALRPASANDCAGCSAISAITGGGPAVLTWLPLFDVSAMQHAAEPFGILSGLQEAKSTCQLNKQLTCMSHSRRPSSAETVCRRTWLTLLYQHSGGVTNRPGACAAPSLYEK